MTLVDSKITNIKEGRMTTHPFPIEALTVTTLIARLYLFVTSPPDTIFRHYVIPVYIIYTVIISFILALAIVLTDKMIVAKHFVVMSALLSIFDATMVIHQSLFNVFIRTGVAVFVTVILHSLFNFIVTRCRCCCCYK